MGTSKQKRVERLRDKYGDNYKLYIFQWKKRAGPRLGGHIGSVPANDITTAMKRLLNDHKRMRMLWQAKVIRGLLRNKKASKYIEVTVLKQDEPLTYQPAEIP